MGMTTVGPRITNRMQLQTIMKSFAKIFFISLPTFIFLVISAFLPTIALGDPTTTLTIPVMQWINLGANLKGNAPVGLKDFGIGYSKDKNMLIIFGGTTASGNKNGQTYLADLNNLVWSSPSDPHGPQARSDMLYGMDVWGSYRNTFVISCGKGDGDVIFNDTWAFDVNYGTWTQIKDVTSMSGPVPQLYSAVGGIDTTTQTGSQVTPNNTMWMSHGTDGTKFYTDLWAQVFRGSWTPNEMNLSTVWYKVPTSGELPQGRKEPGGAILPGGRLAIYGGCNESTADCAIPDVSALVLGSDYNKGTPLSVTNAFWSSKSQCLGAREDAAMVMNGNSGVPAYTTQVIVFGGKSSKNSPVGDTGEVGIMDTSSGVWARVIPQGDSLPKTRAGARMVATGNVVYSSSSSSGVSDILMFGGEALDGSSTNLNDLWILRLSNTPTSSSNATKMNFLDCIISPDKGNTHDNTPSGNVNFNNENLSKSHYLLTTLSYIFLFIATTVLRFGYGVVSIWRIGSIYGALIVASYATAFYGFAVAFEDKHQSHFSTTHGILGLLFLAVLYVLIPILAMISLINKKDSVPHTPPGESNDHEDESSGGGIGSRIATLFHLKSPESSKSPRSFEVNRNGNREDDPSMLKPAGDSWVEKRKSVTESAVYNTSSRGSMSNSKRVSQRYPKRRNSLLVNLMAHIAGRGGRVEDNENPHGESENENRDSRIIGRSPGTGTSHREVIEEEEMDEETKQAELEQEITNREVMVMTIPKRRLTVVNA
ncbi:950_t:CDS:2 [Acaulospora morrowiae]|uniref:950_t:CDS:1 n=1 Tax=Acaulospora morrowiae TaxID=94023 RepID=A0A9N9CM11_9GLOM|nr:950_t:CDS:2 [Acaulospora morrowiae]